MKKYENSKLTLERGFINRILLFCTQNKGEEYGGKNL
jgi:hypothetical protein